MNPLKNVIRKVKAAYTVGLIASFFGLFVIDFSSELTELLKEVFKATLPLFPGIVAYYTRMNSSDILRITLRDE